MAACSASNRKVVGSDPGSALLIPEVNVDDIQLHMPYRALKGSVRHLQPPGSLSQMCGKLYVRIK